MRDGKSVPLERDTGVLVAELRGSTLLVTLHRPHAANALDDELMVALRRLWESVAAEPSVRCIVLTGAGEAFCAGADARMVAGDRASVGDTAAQELAFVPGPQISVPVVVVVNGVCAGGGLHFVADADICIAAKSARFLDPHVSIGQVSALEPVLLRGRMRRDVLARMVLLGKHEQLGSEAARDAGLVSEVVDDDVALERGLALAALITRNSPEAVRLSRRALRRAEEHALATELDLGWELIRRHRAHPDAAEGPIAFLEKRVPKWTS
ncbi:enoyl-CoA hydratase/isomerase family protein [Gordonia jinghuaiqii]|uniref:enoyl-CoA hydratase/isomerase family protein n=1 Tax=Gordonia jinghuaiqii TaxID=2758710 RepID=UPI0021511234|nr:enoyl-CoA hydratase-related protein [Gordonia jinghuaiqii]MCR5978248.1 enoyl-CoA hydratase/isomerase family protein [Gordonia jinghuaiqii]